MSKCCHRKINSLPANYFKSRRHLFNALFCPYSQRSSQSSAGIPYTSLQLSNRLSWSTITDHCLARAVYLKVRQRFNFVYSSQFNFTDADCRRVVTLSEPLPISALVPIPVFVLVTSIVTASHVHPLTKFFHFMSVKTVIHHHTLGF